MFDVYSYFEACKEEGLPSSEAIREFQRDYEEYNTELIEELEERQMQTAWQQDLIDLRRLER